MIKRISLILLLITMFCGYSSAQKLIWNLDLNFQFDNREFAKTQFGTSHTYFGTILTPTIGLEWESGHSLNIGGDLSRTIGQVDPYLNEDLLVYYQYDGEHLKANAGLFPIKRLMGEYPSAFFSDSLSFFDKSIEGMLVQYQRESWYLELALDWFSIPTATTRELFCIYSAGKKRIGHFYGGYAAYMYHYAGSTTVRGVTDDIWINPFIGVDCASWLKMDRCNVKLGWLQTFQNDRKNATGWLFPGGFQSEITLEKWNVGISNTTYIGSSLTPFYDVPDGYGGRYGSGLYFGNQFYSTDSGLYNRLEIYYSPKINDCLSLKISSVHHCDGYGWGWQQKVALSINLNNLKK